jgi:uncharacterized protein YukE
MAQLGLDTEHMTSLSKLMNERASDIDSTISKISTKLGNTWWKGNDAEKFRSEWGSTHKSNLKKVAEALRNVSKIIDNNKQQQEQASR